MIKTKDGKLNGFIIKKKKEVARNNLYLETEDRVDFEKKLIIAEEYRKKSEVYMKYNWLID